VCQVAVIYLLGLRLAELRGTLSPERLAELVAELKRLPHGIAQITGVKSRQVGKGDDAKEGDDAKRGGDADLAAESHPSVNVVGEGVRERIVRIADEHWQR